MSDRERGWQKALEEARDQYRVPAEVPREEMWAAIETKIAERRPIEPTVIPMRRPARPVLRRFAYGSAAAAALLVLGFGVGRWSAAPSSTTEVVAAPEATTIEWAAVDHLGRTESLLTLVQVDGRAGALEPATATWARGLLAETRLLLDAGRVGTPEVETLLEDLELVLMQLVTVMGASDAGVGAGIELQLALNSLETGDLLPRIRAALPNEFVGP